MTEGERKNLDRIEADRKKRERLILLLLLWFGERSLSHARSAVRVGADPVYAATAAITGASHVDGPPLALRLAPLLAETHARGQWRGGRLLDAEAAPSASAADAWAAQQARTLADKTAQAAQRIVSTAVQDASAAGLNTARTLAAMSDAYGAAGFRVGSDFALRAAAERAVVGGYQAGMSAAWETPGIGDRITGFRYVSVLDERTSQICLTYDGTQLPKDHPWWETHFCPNHWHCRALILPLLRDFTPTDAPYWPPPAPGFGRAPSLAFGVPIAA